MLHRRRCTLVPSSSLCSALRFCRESAEGSRPAAGPHHRYVYLATRLVPGGSCEIVRAVPASDGGFQIAEEEAEEQQQHQPPVLRLRGGVGPGDVVRLSARWLDRARPRPSQELPVTCVEDLLHVGPARCQERSDRLRCRHLAECDRCPFATISTEATAAAAVRLAKQLLQRAGFPTSRRGGGGGGSRLAMESDGDGAAKEELVRISPPLFQPAPSAASAAPRRVTRLYRGVTAAGVPAFGLRQRRAIDAATTATPKAGDDELLVGARRGHGGVVDEFAIPRGGVGGGTQQHRGVVETSACAVASRGALAVLECLNRLLRHPQPGRQGGVEALAFVDVLEDDATGGFAVYVFTSDQLGYTEGVAVTADGAGFDPHAIDEALRGCSPGGRPVSVFAADVTNRGGLRLLGDERWRPATGHVTVYTPSGQRAVPYPLLPNGVVPATPSLQGGADLLVTAVAHVFRSAGHALAAARGRRVAVFPATDGALAHGVGHSIAHDVATSKLVRKLCPPTLEGPRRARATIALHATENIAAIGKRWIMRHGREQRQQRRGVAASDAGDDDAVASEETSRDVLHLNTDEFDSRKAAGAGFTLVFDAAQHGRGRRLPLRLRHSADAAIVILPGSSTPDEIRTAWFDAVDRDAKPPTIATVVCHDPSSDDFLLVLSSV